MLILIDHLTGSIERLSIPFSERLRMIAGVFSVSVTFFLRNLIQQKLIQELPSRRANRGYLF